MSKFLKIVENVTPNKDKKATQSLLKLFNHMWVDDVEIVGEDRIKVTLFSGEYVEFEVVNYVGKQRADAAEDNEYAASKPALTQKQKDAVNVGADRFMKPQTIKGIESSMEELGGNLQRVIKDLAQKIR